MKKVDLIDLNKNITKDVYVNYLYDFSVELEDVLVNTKIHYDGIGNFKGFAIENNRETLTELLSKDDVKNKIPETLSEYRRNFNDIKVSKVAFSKGTGNSSRNSYSTSLYIPATWLNELGINKDDNKVVMKFNGESIIITKI